MALDGAVPAGGAGLRGRRQEAGGHRDGGEGGKLRLVRGRLVGAVVVASPGAVASVDAPGQVVVAVVSTRVIEEVSPGAETVTVDHPSWSLERGVEIVGFRDTCIDHQSNLWKHLCLLHLYYFLDCRNKTEDIKHLAKICGLMW